MERGVRIADDPAADNTDVYAFVSPDKPNTVTIIAKYIAFEDRRSSTAFSRRTASRFDLESAVARADNLIGPDETVELARRARAARRSIYGDDALAWALARAGRCAEAIPLARRALQLGTEDGLLWFHLGYAQRCAGDKSAMRESYRRALALHPQFSVRWAPVARAALRNG